MKNKLTWIRALSFLVAAILITIGILAGQDVDIMTKAIRICLECVGIG